MLRNKLSTSTIKGPLHTKSEIRNCFEFDVTNDHFNKNIYDFKNKEEMENQENWETENEIAAD